MGGIKKLLARVIDTAPHGKLVSVLFKGLKGELDVEPLDVSPDASGRKLVLKGWPQSSNAVSVKYSAEWENPDGGVIYFKAATDRDYRATTGGKAVYAGAGGKLSLKLSFRDSAGAAHVAKFYTELL
jgi:hypothetical protein